MVTKAGQPEILRAAQRDEAFQTQLSDYVSDFVHSLFGIQTWLKYREACRVGSNAMYQALTTLSRLQTLGEEYTGIVQTNSAGSNLPSKPTQVAMVLLNTCGEGVLDACLHHTEKYLEQLPPEHPLRPEARAHLVAAVQGLRGALPLLHRLHRAAFYLSGDCYHVAKRVTGVRYALVRHWLLDRTSLPTFRLLGWLSLLHLALHSALGLARLGRRQARSQGCPKPSDSSQAVDSWEKCALCLNPRDSATATPCGHLFCWSCIVAWLQEQPNCPLCRQPVQPSRVVALHNYHTRPQHRPAGIQT